MTTGCASTRRVEAVGPATSSPPTRPVPGRHRPLPPRADGALLRGLGRRVRRHASTSSWRSATSPASEADAPFNMAVMGLRLAALPTACPSCTAGSAGRCSRPVAGRARGGGADRSVTNGVHARTWVSAEMDELLEPLRAAGVARGRRRPLGPHRRRRRRRAVAGPGAGPGAPGGLRCASTCATRLQARGVSASDVAWTRRGARPRRADASASPAASPPTSGPRCCSRSPSACRPCSTSTDRPVQFVFAGKAHPADDAGKELIRQIVAFSRDPDVRHRIVFVEDYDIDVARRLLPGLRRLAEQPPPAAGGLRHQRHEGGAQRRAQLLDPRRLVGRVFDGENGWAIALGRVATTTSPSATRSRPRASSTCSSARSSRCSTSATTARCPGAGCGG